MLTRRTFLASLLAVVLPQRAGAWWTGRATLPVAHRLVSMPLYDRLGHFTGLMLAGTTTIPGGIMVYDATLLPPVPPGMVRVSSSMQLNRRNQVAWTTTDKLIGQSR